MMGWRNSRSTGKGWAGLEATFGRNTQVQSVGRCISDDGGSNNNTLDPDTAPVQSRISPWTGEVDAASSTRPICVIFARLSMGELGDFDAGGCGSGLLEWSVSRRERRKKGEWEKEGMDGSITGFTDRTASQPAPAEHQYSKYCLRLECSRWGAANGDYLTRAMCASRTNVT